jgi:surface carbohydrate biosynthesis protein
MRKKHIYLPIDVKAREFNAKALLAIHAIASDFNVVIGPKTEVYRISHQLPPGLMLNLGLGADFVPLVKKFRSEGHLIWTVDEEGLVIHDEEIYFRQRVCDEVAKLSDTIICWGKVQKNLIDRTPEAASKTFSLGNPRMDLLTPRLRIALSKESAAIREKHGRFLLFNTNFQMCNHFLGENGYINLLSSKKVLATYEDRAYNEARISWKARIRDEFMALLPQIISQFPELNIVIRPHPSENHKFWSEFALKHDRLTVAFSGSVLPWILASETIIHNCCTTAVEALLLGKVPIAFRPYILAGMEAQITNDASLQAYTSEEAIAAIRLVLTGDRKFDNLPHLPKPDISHFVTHCEEETASQRIIKHLMELSSSLPKLGNTIAIRKIRNKYLIRKYLNALSSLFSQEKVNQVGEDYEKQKAPPILRKELLESLSHTSKEILQGRSIRVQNLAPSTYHICLK